MVLIVKIYIQTMPEDTLRGQSTQAADTIEEESALFLAKEEVKC